MWHTHVHSFFCFVTKQQTIQNIIKILSFISIIVIFNNCFLHVDIAFRRKKATLITFLNFLKN